MRCTPPEPEQSILTTEAWPPVRRVEKKHRSHTQTHNKNNTKQHTTRRHTHTHTHELRGPSEMHWRLDRLKGNWPAADSPQQKEDTSFYSQTFERCYVFVGGVRYGVWGVVLVVCVCVGVGVLFSVGVCVCVCVT